MTRFTLPPLLLLIALFTVSAQPLPLDLKGKTLADTFDELLPGISSLDNGVRSNAQQRWQDICFVVGAPGNEKLRLVACKLMAPKLDAKTPTATRLWMLQQLQRIGHEESVNALAAVLEDPDDEIREAAVRALANNPSPKATEKLLAALEKAKGKAKIGILNGLGHRGDPIAIADIKRELKGDVEIALAAARALGRIPTEGSYNAMIFSWRDREITGEVRAAISDAMLVHADRLVKIKQIKEAHTIYSILNVPEMPRSIHLAAMRGLIQTSDDESAGHMVLVLLESGDLKVKAIAIGQIEYLSAGALKTVAASMDKLPVPTRVLVITAIAARGDKTLLPIALNAAQSAEPELKKAGLIALGRLGNASTSEFLLGAMFGKDAPGGLAADSLTALAVEGVNEKIIAALEAEQIAARRVALIGVLERRKAVGAVPVLLNAAADADVGVRTAAFSGLKVLALPEHVPGMIAGLLKTAKGNERNQAELAIVAVSAQIAHPEKRAEPVLAFIKRSPKNTADLLPLLGRLGGAEAQQTVREALASTEPGLRDAAVLGLCNWPTVSANDDLLALAEKGRSDAEKLRATQALIRINTVLIDRTPEERLAALIVMKKTMDLASREQERKAILEGLGNIRHIETLRYVVPYLDQPAFAQSACKGIVELAHSKMLREPNKAEFEKALDRVIALCKDKGLVDRARQYKEGR